MIKKLAKHGESWAIVIEQPVLDLLEIGPETPLEISTSGHSLIVTPAIANDEHHDQLKAIVDEIDRKHAKALKRLAE